LNDKSHLASIEHKEHKFEIKTLSFNLNHMVNLESAEMIWKYGNDSKVWKYSLKKIMHLINFENKEHKLEEKDLNLFELWLENCKTIFIIGFFTNSIMTKMTIKSIGLKWLIIFDLIKIRYVCFDKSFFTYLIKLNIKLNMWCMWHPCGIICLY
jgi:hypothetical protein